MFVQVQLSFPREYCVGWVYVISSKLLCLKERKKIACNGKFIHLLNWVLVFTDQYLIYESIFIWGSDEEVLIVLCGQLVKPWRTSCGPGIST